MNSLVSIVITTKNEESNIEKCLKSILQQTYRNIEIIVVDNNSTDQTKSIAMSKGVKVYNLGPERSAQRNFGMIEKSHGDFVIYIDADMLLTENLISECVTFLENDKEVIALYIPELVLGRTVFSRIRRFERGFYDGTVIDACRFFRREKFIESGGFDEELFKSGSGEDWDLDKKIRNLGKVAVLPKDESKASVNLNNWLIQYAFSQGVVLGTRDLLLHDESKDRLLPYLRKKSYYASGFSGYISKWGRNDPDIKLQFSAFYRLCKVFMENGKWMQSLSRPHLLAMTIILKLLVGIATIAKWR